MSLTEEFESKALLGEVGFTFRKHFEGFGWFKGKIVSIRPGAARGKDRRCIYSDGDVEDLSIQEITALVNKANASADNPSSLKVKPMVLKSKESNHSKVCETSAPKLNEHYDKHQSPNKKPCSKKRNLQVQDGPKNKFSRSEEDQSEALFDSPDNVPIDEAAEATMMSDIATRTRKAQPEDDEQDERMTDIWLEQIASRFVRSKCKPTVAKRQSIQGLSVDSWSGSPDSGKLCYNATEGCDSPSPATSGIEENALCYVTDLKPGSRFGFKVFHVEDKSRVVGEILVESRGWIEAAFGERLMKGRAAQFIVAPTGYKVGDLVDPELALPLPIAEGRQSQAPRSEICASPSCQQYEKNGSLQHPRQSTESGKKKPKSIKSLDRSTLSESIKPDQVFYWECDRCDTINSYRDLERCTECTKSRRSSAKLSALLEVALSAVSNAWSLESAEELLPISERVAVPTGVLATLLRCMSDKELDYKDAPIEEIKLETVLYWICSHCTVVNGYTKSKCKTCLKLRTTSSVPSSLLHIAEKAAKWARNAEDALEALLPIHRRAIPSEVMGSLITCVAKVGKDRNCLKPKVEGSDFCDEHGELHALDKSLSYSEDGKTLLNADLIPEKATVTDISSVGSSCVDATGFHRKSEFEEKANTSGESLASQIQTGLASYVDEIFGNPKNLFVHDTEDAILCDETNPFPLGSLVRRFFPWYGFHDGRIVSITRKRVKEFETGVERPVLLYRVVYDDGDKEDLMHHEISSLRQLYNQRYKEPTSIPSRQIPPGLILECRNDTFVEIVRHSTAVDAAQPAEGGIVRVILRKKGGPLKHANLKLTELQVNVVRKIGFNNSFRFCSSVSDLESLPSENRDKLEAIISSSQLVLDPACPPHNTSVPILEWPSRGIPTPLNHENKPEEISEEWSVKELEDDCEVTPGLWLLQTKAMRDSVIARDSEATPELTLAPAQDQVVCSRENLSRPESNWDPADTMHYIHWDPYGHLSCEICQDDKNEHQILICDECHLGFHMYCVRPVMVNVPTGEWRCPRCSPSRNIENSFRDLVSELRSDPSLVVSFLKLQLTCPSDFHSRYENSIKIIQLSKVQRSNALGSIPRSLPIHKIEDLYFSHHNAKGDWILPQPLPMANIYGSSLLSMVAAMRYCGMVEYSEDLLYRSEVGVSESMNDPLLDLEQIGKMSQRNVDIFKAFKHNIKAGLFPPIRMIYDKKLGFSVEAVTSIQKHTLIAEYIGEVTTVERSGETSSDSLMVLLNTDDPKTSLVIDPSKAGNIARFLNGVNNANPRSLRKVNVRSRRFVLDGRCRVALFTSRPVDAGETLCYDYNAGMMGKDAEEWAKNGFYDTSNFI